MSSGLPCPRSQRPPPRAHLSVRPLLREPGSGASERPTGTWAPEQNRGDGLGVCGEASAEESDPLARRSRSALPAAPEALPGSLTLLTEAAAEAAAAPGALRPYGTDALRGCLNRTPPPAPWIPSPQYPGHSPAPRPPSGRTYPGGPARPRTTRLLSGARSLTGGGQPGPALPPPRSQSPPRSAA